MFQLPPSTHNLNPVMRAKAQRSFAEDSLSKNNRAQYTANFFTAGN